MKNLLLIGPQGCGKGTQAEMIVKKFELTHVEMGGLIRKRASLHDRKAEIIDHLANKRGMLLPDGVVMDMIYAALEEHPTDKGYLFDGFPRTVAQYNGLRSLFDSKHMTLHAGLYLRISDKESIKRLGSRRVCSVCHKGYSLILEPERRTCDCGGELVKRIDDEDEAITRRLAAFHAQTQPILDLMRQDGLLKEIHGEQEVAKIFDDIQKIIQAL